MQNGQGKQTNNTIKIKKGRKKNRERKKERKKTRREK
jgi:hypothetical protein